MGKSRNNAIFAGFVTSSTPQANDSLIFTGDKFIYDDVTLVDDITLTQSAEGILSIKSIPLNLLPNIPETSLETISTGSLQDIPNLTVLGNVSGVTANPDVIYIKSDISSSVFSDHDSVASAKSIQEYVSSSIETALTSVTNSIQVTPTGNLKKWTENEITGKNIGFTTYQKRIWIDKDNRIMGNGYTGYNEFNNYHDWVWREQVHLPDLNEIPEKVYAGFYHIAVLTESGKLYFAGRNNNNMFSVPTSSFKSGDYKQSQLLRGFLSDDGVLDDVKFTKIAFAEEHFPVNIAALTDSGSVYVAGYNQYGQLGNGYVTSTFYDGPSGQLSSTPLWSASYASPPSKAVDIFQVGQYDGRIHPTTTVIQLENGEMRTCGWGRYGQIGNGSSSDSNPTLTTVKINATTELTNVTSSIVWGYDKETGVFAVTTEGYLYGWGYGTRNPFGRTSDTNANLSYATRLDTGISGMEGNVLQVYRGHNQIGYEPTFVKCTNPDSGSNGDNRQFIWFGAGMNHEQMITTSSTHNDILSWTQFDDPIFTTGSIDVHTMWYGVGTGYQTHFVIATNYTDNPNGVEELYTIGTWHDGCTGIGRAPWDSYARDGIVIEGHYIKGWTKVPLSSDIVSKIIQINSQDFSYADHSRTTEIITSDGHVYFAGRDYYTFVSPTYGNHYTLNFTKVDNI